jgi:hypothetical protein
MSERVLALAAEMVDEAWCQNALRRPNGARCVLGALIDAGEVVGESYLPAWVALHKELGLNPSKPLKFDLIWWNNTPERTAIEVSTALRNAKRHLEAD